MYINIVSKIRLNNIKTKYRMRLCSVSKRNVINYFCFSFICHNFIQHYLTKKIDEKKSKKDSVKRVVLRTPTVHNDKTEQNFYEYKAFIVLE